MMINLYYKSSSRCVCLESALLCVKKGQVTSRYYSSPSLPSVEAWYFSLRGCNRLLRGSCWKWTAEAESVNLLTSPGSVTKLVCQRAIYVLGGELHFQVKCWHREKKDPSDFPLLNSVGILCLTAPVYSFSLRLEDISSGWWRYFPLALSWLLLRYLSPPSLPPN